MQDSIKAERLKEIGHSQSIILPQSDDQIVLEDTRLRKWKLAASGGLTVANPVNAVLNGNGEIVRIRTTDGSPYAFTGMLDIRYAAPNDSITWSGNTITEGALAGGGVALWATGNTLDAFWVDDDAITIKTARSTDGGHTWGASSTIHTLGTQSWGVLCQLTAPCADTLIFSDSTVGVTEDDELMTGLYITMKVSGTWITPVLWDLGGHLLGIEERIELPNGDSYTSNLSAVEMEPGRLIYSFFGNSFREISDDGIWVGRVANLDYTTPTQNLHWASPDPVFQSIGLDDDNERSTFFESFPRIQIIGNEYWITCLEVSRFSGHFRYHLAIHRSTDGIHWSDRDYNQGAANDEQEGAYVYDDATPFLVTDLIYANLIVTGNYVFIVGYDKVFYCPATSKVGVDNPQKKIDLGRYISEWNMNLPTAPTAGSVNYTLDGAPKFWTDEDLVSAHYGIRITHSAGYYDQTGGEDALIQLGEFNVDSISQHGEIGDDAFTIRGIDDTMLMERWKADTFWQWESAQEMVYQRFCDTSPFIVTQGGFTTGYAGRMRAGVVRSQDNFFDNIAVFNLDSVDGGVCVTRFECETTWQRNHVGIAFQGRGQGDGEDNKYFWAVLYNRNGYDNKFTLQQSIPRTNPNHAKLYRYRPAVAESSAIVLDDDTVYWLRVGVWHSHVMVWYTDEPGGVFNPNWTLVLDYQAPASPPREVIPCRYEWWGLIGTQRTTPSGAIGNLRSDGGMQDLFNGTNPRMVALHIQLGNEASILRRINISLTQENTDSLPMPDAIVLLINGDANNPYDATDPDNVIYSGSPSALFFSAHDDPSWLGANAPANPELPRLEANQHVWVCVSFDGILDTGQSYKWASSLAGGGPTKYSDDEGATWNNFSNPDLELTASIEVEYLAGRVKFYKLHYGSADPSYTYENLAHHIAAKAGVLDIRPDDWLNYDDLTLGPDSILWQPEEFGMIDDFEMQCHVITQDRVEVYLVQSEINNGGDNGFMIRLDISNQRVIFFYGGAIVGRAESLTYIPYEFDLKVIKRHTLCYVYINECLASIQHHKEFSQEGFVGLDPGDYLEVVWESMRIPDLTSFVKQWEIRAGQSALQSLSQLCAKPAPGTTARARFYIDYLGRLRIGTFRRQSVVDTYEDTILSEDKEQSTRDVFSQITPVGNYYATRWNPILLDSDGKRHEMKDITDGRHDRAAYRAAQEEFLNILEKRVQHTVRQAPVWPIEREDLNLVRNPLLQTNQNLVVDNVNFRFKVNEGGIDLIQEVGYRVFGGEVVE